ncbi:MAG: chloride channel protein [Deltaproteobacteria bacterium]|nr:chloride channel protein [Deltaproteobacteria bacterium]
MAILASLVGLTSALGAIGFLQLLELFQIATYGARGDLLQALEILPWYARMWLPALGGVVVGLLVYFKAKEAKGHSVPEVLEAVALRKGVIKKRAFLVETLASAVTIGTGGSAGIVGPIVQLGSGIGSAIGQFPRLSGARIRSLVGCGAAAGIAAAFNAPIAGTMFALEVVLGDFGVATFSPIVISAVVATAVSRHFLGDFPAMLVPAYRLVSVWELPLYVCLGFFCAVVAVFFTKVFYRAGDVFEDLALPRYAKPLLGGLFLGLTGLVYPHILGNGYPAIDLVLMEKLSLGMIFSLMVLKILATSITIGSGGAGGTFAPSLFIGAMAGGFFGSIVHDLLPGVTASAGAYSIVGMAAVVAGTTRGPLSAILMLFEITGNYTIILPLMIACIASSVASGQMLRESIFTLKLVRKGIDIHAGKEVNVLKSILVGEVMNPQVETVPENMTLGRLAGLISNSKYNSFPVVDSRGELTGILSFLDYHDVLFEKDLESLVVAKELATTRVVTVSVDDNLLTALERISSRDFSILPVVDPDNPSRIRGVLTSRDITSAYNRAVLKKGVFGGQ